MCYVVNMRQNGNCEDNEARTGNSNREQSGKASCITKETNSIHFMHSMVPSINFLSHVYSARLFSIQVNMVVHLEHCENVANVIKLLH